ncbi:MAG: hypothetical protein QXG03_04500 [Halalkalicoccus sp.]
MKRPSTRTGATPNDVLVDKCGMCETWFLTDSVADLSRRLHAHELDAHGRVAPTRADHRHSGSGTDSDDR